MEKCYRVNYNWFATETNGEEYETREVGKEYPGFGKVASIDAHYPAGEGDKMTVTITYEDESYNVIFNPNQLYFK